VTTRFLESFLRDIRKVRDGKVREQVARAIEAVERAGTPAEIAHFKWLVGHPSYGRVRVGDWRLGVIVAGDAMTFVRCLHRREIYRYFP
jgi:mRNA interferase RelE/StbE